MQKRRIYHENNRLFHKTRVRVVLVYCWLTIKVIISRCMIRCVQLVAPTEQEADADLERVHDLEVFCTG